MSKNRKNKLVPKLRFKLPDGSLFPEWKNVKLSELAKLVTERNKSNSISRVLTNSASEGIIDQRDYFDRDIANKDNLDNYYIVDHGDYVYNPRISTIAPVGPISKNRIAKGVMSPLYTVFRFTDSANDFFENYFKTTHWHQFLRSVSNSGARHDRMNISPTVFMDMNLPYPDTNEQQKIADCLFSLDEVINAESKKLESLKVHKKGLMQNLFPQEGETVPKIRFPEFMDSGEWAFHPIGSKVDSISGYPFPSSEISEDSNGVPLMRGINITEGYIRHNFDIDRYFVGKQNLQKFQLRTGDLVIGMDGSKVGKNCALISDADAGSLLVQRVARLRTEREGMTHYIFQHINSRSFHSYVNRINTSGGIPHISLMQIEEFKVCFPPTDNELLQITDCLSCLDDLVTAQNEKLLSLNLHKKGLMQQLFPSTNDIKP
jgi:type I restriction enzyme S subunit